MTHRFRLATPLRVARARVVALRQELAASSARRSAADERLALARRGLEAAYQDLREATGRGADTAERGAFVALLAEARRWVERCRGEAQAARDELESLKARLLRETRRVDSLEAMRLRDLRAWRREIEKHEQRILDDAHASRTLRAELGERRSPR